MRHIHEQFFSHSKTENWQSQNGNGEKAEATGKNGDGRKNEAMGIWELGRDRPKANLTGINGMQGMRDNGGSSVQSKALPQRNTGEKPHLRQGEEHL